MSKTLKHHNELIRSAVNHHANNVNGQTHLQATKDSIRESSSGNTPPTKEQVEKIIASIHQQNKR